MVLNIAHRGARSLAPENTLAAARAAKKVGADSWEADVAVTADESLILFHDDSLARTTDATQRFPERSPWLFTTFTYEEIRSLDAGSWFVDRDPFGELEAGSVPAEEQAAYRGEKVPSVREALLFTVERDWRINLELKRLPPPMEHFPVTERVLALIEELGIPPHRFVLSSFNHDWLREVQSRHSQIEVQALIGYSREEPQDWGPLEFRTYNARALHTREHEIRSLGERGISVNVYVVNEEAEMRKFIAAGVAGIITDYPQRLAALLQREGRVV